MDDTMVGLDVLEYVVGENSVYTQDQLHCIQVTDDNGDVQLVAILGTEDGDDLCAEPSVTGLVGEGFHLMGSYEMEGSQPVSDSAEAIGIGDIYASVDEGSEYCVTDSYFQCGEPDGGAATTSAAAGGIETSTTELQLYSATEAEVEACEVDNIQPEITDSDATEAENLHPVTESSETDIVINGQRCVVRVDPSTGHLVAYPSLSPAQPEIIPQQTAKKPRGRPRKHPIAGLPSGVVTSVSDGASASSDSPELLSEQENSAAAVLLDLADTRQKACQPVKISSSSDCANVHGKDATVAVQVQSGELQFVSMSQPSEQQNTAFNTTNKVQNFLASLGLPVKRGRGRPRRKPLPGTSLPSFIMPTTTMIGSQTSTNSNETHTTIVIEQEDGTERHIVLPVPLSGLTSKPAVLPVTTAEYATDTGREANVTITKAESQDTIHETSDETTVPLPIVQIVVVPKKDPVKIGLRASEVDLEKLRCRRCAYQAYYMQQLQQHIREQHAGDTDGIQRCKCCSFVSFEESDLLSHFRELHPRCICSVCNFTSEHAYVIKRHMQRHNSHGCECSMCGRTYKDQYILKMHIKMRHMEPEVLFQCHMCTRTFTRKAHLKRHLRIHNPDKPYKCAHCDYRGCERSDISKHILIHDLPHHSCDVCGKAFRHMKNKELHMKRHRGQRDYKCLYCDFLGYTYTDIRKHQERKHSMRMCTRCGAVFKSELQLQAHQQMTCSILMDQSGIVGSNSSAAGIMDYVASGAIQLDSAADESGPTSAGSHIIDSNPVTFNVAHMTAEGLNLIDIQMDGVEESQIEASEDLKSEQDDYISS